MRKCKNLILAFVALVGAIATLAPSTATAMPSFARQTGMNCNSCHVGTDGFPNFTRTGRLFAMKGYTRPYVRERIRHDGDTIEDMPQYGGHYLALNWNDFWAMRFQPTLFAGGKAANGTKLDTTSDILQARFFFTGAITDWLGLWTEFGYLGANQLNSVTTGRQGGSGLNYFANDEFRLAASWDYGTNSFWGLSVGNENPNVVGQWNFPVGTPDTWYNGQGGAGRSRNIMNISLHTFFDDRWWLQAAAVSGGDNANWSNGSNYYFMLGYDMVRTNRDDRWLKFEYYGGNDFPSIMSTYKDSFLCPTQPCPAGVSDANLSITNQLGFSAAPVLNAPLEVVDKFKSWKIGFDWVRADYGPHTFYWSTGIHGMKEDFKSGGSVERVIYGTNIRYFWQRTYGFEAVYWKDSKYKYVNAAGLSRGVLLKPRYTLNLYFVPAMNFSTHININPKVQNTVFEDQADLYQGKGSSYSLGFEYNF
jgi:hypothetical protein